MRRETFPNLPADGGAFYNNPDIHTRRINAVRAIPERYFQTGYYVSPLAMPFARYTRGCKLYQLAMAETGRFDTFKLNGRLGEDNRLAQYILVEKLKKDLNFPQEFSYLLEQAYEWAGGGKSVAFQLLEAIPLGANLREVATTCYQAQKGLKEADVETYYLKVVSILRLHALHPVLLTT